jgi:hypothetical protein
MKQWYWCVGLLVGMGSLTTSARAQQPAPIVQEYQIVPAGAVSGCPCPSPDNGRDSRPPNGQATGLLVSVFGWSDHPIHDCLHRHGFACWTELASPRCSSISSELTIMFGSCRQFFSEPCYIGPGAPPGGSCPNCRP